MEDKYMSMALEEAKKAFSLGEIPVGAVIVKDNQVISTGFNMKEKNEDVTAHAEIIAIRKAEEKLKNWRLDGCDIYVTLEPCSMCASAIHQSRINNIYYGLPNSDVNNKRIISQILGNNYLNHKVGLVYFKNNQIEELMTTFFKQRRKK